ncbi:la-related protein 7 isoform X1 [Gadus morhua]|uniref:la-related protein 7 isoform X1 n=1 Tax=Gadus morhua TaxID=8049 RepID=UPI0011B851F0|nr:la-related protein 7 isoform X1 [Gadus morhua]XP_030193726.1 la-related protein 7 isoform X1 [Gadus morhua]
MIDTERRPAPGQAKHADPEGKTKESEKKKRPRVKQLLADIKKQVEFWFGDVNLGKDRFIKQLITDSADGYVDISVLTTFNRMKKLTMDTKLIARALKNSTIVEVNLEGNKLRRQQPIRDTDKNVDGCTVYVELLPKSVTHDWVEKVFAKCGKVVYISIPRYQTTKDPKGFAFVEFDKEEEAQKAIELLNNPPEDAPRKTGMFPKIRNKKGVVIQADDPRPLPGEEEEKKKQKKKKKKKEKEVAAARVEEPGELKEKLKEEEMEPQPPKGKRKRSEGEAPEDRARKESAPEDPARKESAPEDRARKESAPEDPARKESAPEDPARKESAPEDRARKESAPEDPARKESAPEDRARKGSAPEQSDKKRRRSQAGAGEQEAEVEEEKPAKLRRTGEEQQQEERAGDSQMDVKAEPAEGGAEVKAEGEGGGKGDGSPLKAKRKRKKKKEKMGDEVIPLRVLSKKDWLGLKQEYLALQKRSMASLKKCITKIDHQEQPGKKVASAEKKLGPSEKKVIPLEMEIEKMEKEITGPQFTSGVILKITDAKPLPGRKIIKDALSKISTVAYVDILEGDSEGHIRFKTPEEAQAVVNDRSAVAKEHGWTLDLLSGDHEQRYWQKILVDRQVKLNRPREKKRGTEKLISKAEKIIMARAKEANKHIHFQDV